MGGLITYNANVHLNRSIHAGVVTSFLCNCSFKLFMSMCSGSLLRATIWTGIRSWVNLYSETWITRTAGDHQSLSYEKFELRVMLSLSFTHVATKASLVYSMSWLKFLKFVRFSSRREKKTMKLSLLHTTVNTSSCRKGNLMALTVLY